MKWIPIAVAALAILFAATFNPPAVDANWQTGCRGQKPAVCHSLVELLDLYPTTASLCGLELPDHLQGRDISDMLVDPTHEVRDAGVKRSRMGSRR